MQLSTFTHAVKHIHSCSKAHCTHAFKHTVLMQLTTLYSCSQPHCTHAVNHAVLVFNYASYMYVVMLDKLNQG